MTVAVFVKVYDGLVLATDSASTVRLPDGSAQVYNSADKIFHLHRELPIAAMTWGLGQIGPASISTLAKDLRRRLMGDDGDYAAWKLHSGSYTVELVAKYLSEMFHGLLADLEDEMPENCLGMCIVGYSAHEQQSEVWELYLDGRAKSPPKPTLIAPAEAAGYKAYAQPKAADRLFLGFDEDLISELHQVLPAEHHDVVRVVLQNQALQPVIAPMPFPDAIAFAKYLVEVTAGFSHFLLGPDTVGGPIEVAGVSRHEGFKWVNRKHYFSAEFNQGAVR